jgi:hypothetical protein
MVGQKRKRVLRMLPLKYPEAPFFAGKVDADPGRNPPVRVMPTVISVLDYSKGFGHTDLVTI